ncbi:hypothetical protein VTI74DRAFT_5065 [Chaetomium olivicolor]
MTIVQMNLPDVDPAIRQDIYAVNNKDPANNKPVIDHSDIVNSNIGGNVGDSTRNMSIQGMANDMTPLTTWATMLRTNLKTWRITKSPMLPKAGERASYGSFTPSEAMAKRPDVFDNRARLVR